MSQIHGEGCPKPWDTPRDVPNPWDTPREFPWFWASLLRKNAPKWQKNALHRFHTHCTRTLHARAHRTHAARARRTHAPHAHTARSCHTPYVHAKKCKDKGTEIEQFPHQGCTNPWETPRGVPWVWDIPRGVPRFWASLLKNFAFHDIMLL